MTTLKGEQVISYGWSAAGITNALKNGETCLEPLDPFADIDPLVSEPSVEQDDVIYSKWTKALFSICRPKMKRFLQLGEEVLRWKYFWCYSSGIVICNFYWFSTELFPKYTSLNLILIFSISFFSLYKIVFD